VWGKTAHCRSRIAVCLALSLAGGLKVLADHSKAPGSGWPAGPSLASRWSLPFPGNWKARASGLSSSRVSVQPGQRRRTRPSSWPAQGGEQTPTRYLFSLRVGLSIAYKGRFGTKSRAIPGVTPVLDSGSDVARRFGAQTSGHVLAYDRAGNLAFFGRHHLGQGARPGDNPGLEALVTLVNSGKTPISQNPRLRLLNSLIPKAKPRPRDKDGPEPGILRRAAGSGLSPTDRVFAVLMSWSMSSESSWRSSSLREPGRDPWRRFTFTSGPR